MLQLSTSAQASWYERFLRTVLLILPANDALKRLAQHTLYDDVFLCQQRALSLARAPIPSLLHTQLQEVQHSLVAVERSAGGCVPLTPHLELCQDTTDLTSLACDDRVCVHNKRGLTCYCRLGALVAV